MKWVFAISAFALLVGFIAAMDQEIKTLKREVSELKSEIETQRGVNASFIAYQNSATDLSQSMIAVLGMLAERGK